MRKPVIVRLGNRLLVLALLFGASSLHAQLDTCPNISFEIVDQNDVNAGRFVGEARVGTTPLVVYECGDDICMVNLADTPPTRETIRVPDGGNFVAHPDVASYDNLEYVLYTYRTTSSPDSELLLVYDRNNGSSELVTVDMNGEPAYGRYYGFASIAVVEGQPVVAFSSFNNNLVPGDSNNDGDVFIRNLATDTTQLVSKSSVGVQGNGMSGYGRRVWVGDASGYPVVTFFSQASNLVPGDNNGEGDIFIHRTETGTTTRVSSRPGGGELYYGSEISAMDDRGEFVVFSAAPDPDPYFGLFIWDAETGTVQRITVPATGDGNEDDSPLIEEFLTIQQRGRFVYFSSTDDNLVPGDDNFSSDIFVHDVEKGITRLLSYVPDGNGGCQRVDGISEVDSSEVFSKIVFQYDGTIYLSSLDLIEPEFREIDINPEPGESTDTFAFSAQVFDVNLGPVTEFRVDEGDWLPAAQVPITLKAATVTGQFSGSGLADGLHSLCLRARDLRGNEGISCKDFGIVPERPIRLFSVRCSHSPLLPAPGENVTYSAEVLDFNGEPLSVDTIEIWSGATDAPALQIVNGSQAGWVEQAAGASHTYGCRAVQDGEAVFSGWRLHANAGYDDSHAIPLIKTGEADERIDIVFIADRLDYTDPTDAAFLADVQTMLVSGYWSEAWFRDNQAWFNFWLARETGLAKRSDEDKCDHRLPGMSDDATEGESSLWDQHYAFADSGAILHTRALRDCASRLGVFSAEIRQPRVIVHESGHRPFGLGDEYCCDGGNYQRSTLPNLWETQAACEADLDNLIDPANQCTSFVNAKDETWWVSDPDDDHMMSNNQSPRAADLRRMNWMIRRCMDGDC